MVVVQVLISGHGSNLFLKSWIPTPPLSQRKAHSNSSPKSFIFFPSDSLSKYFFFLNHDITFYKHARLHFCLHHMSPHGSGCTPEATYLLKGSIRTLPKLAGIASPIMAYHRHDLRIQSTCFFHNQFSPLKITSF